jgi:hypothetical protein
VDGTEIRHRWHPRLEAEIALIDPDAQARSSYASASPERARLVHALRGAAVEAANWRLDVKGADVRASLAAAGVPCLLLKGRAFAALLYADGTVRPYSDCDLLVEVGLRRRAEAVLGELGFAARSGARHSAGWHREADDMWIDLHHTLPQLDGPPENVWATLSARATQIVVGGARTLVLDPAAAAMLTALHLVSHGSTAPGPREDLERALAQLDDDCWNGAAALARDLGGDAAMGTGLRLLPAGVAVAERLGLAWAPSVHALLHWSGAPWEASVWEAVMSASSHRARASLLAGFLVPSREFIRARSALARRGRPGLWLAYLVRPFHLTARAVGAFGAWRHARRIPPEPWTR